MVSLFRRRRAVPDGAGRRSPALHPLGRHPLCLPAAGVHSRHLGESRRRHDLLLPAPIPCFYTLVFPLAGLFSSLLSHSILRPGFLCSLAAAAIAFALTDCFACFVLWSRGKAAWEAGAFVALREFCVTLPWSVPVTLLFRAVFRRTHPDD